MKRVINVLHPCDGARRNRILRGSIWHGIRASHAVEDAKHNSPQRDTDYADSTPSQDCDVSYSGRGKVILLGCIVRRARRACDV